jgi:threonyl-tRNA synthetase
VLRRLPGREQVELPLAEAIALLAKEATPPDMGG